ncbi:tRNA1(Val) (adenine(37)-N6)-methyltransferase [Desulforhopalus sp. IMCC35007]|uniref:tRNA1(Val) (adenine(37)-N6)-methyltransferase n=1 Tax=Desulforhopalus sp. IMCC35007 TaxID=2569543 RepID=UPI0010AE9DBF|nr:methyltransferase [Desulforhopalus sp. IMCC35007]TKB11114.1 methyltransferase domain-containing protein [Desulforhopalus sp. IMCC35007]
MSTLLFSLIIGYNTNEVKKHLIVDKVNDGIDCNSLFDGDLICEQYKSGYRFSIDAVLLAHFVTVKKDDRILDLGTGSGIILLILLYRYDKIIRNCAGIEVQDRLFSLAKNNILNNSYLEQCTILHGDMRKIQDLCRAGSFDSIVCNPPFYPEHTGRMSTNREEKTARHQVTGEIDDFLAAAAYAVKNRGNIFFIYPADLLGEFILAASRYKFEVKKLRFVYSYPGSQKGAQLVLVHCSKNGGKGVYISEPLYVYTEKNGLYTREVDEYYQKKGSLIT